MAPVFRATSTAAFDALYRRHAPSVYRFAYAVLGNHPDAEDVTQQTFLNAYRALSQGTKPRKPENWLLTIAHNEVRRHFRSSRGKSLEVELDERVAPPAPEESEVTAADVLRALQHLPPAQRTALVMREFEGRSYAEIAEVMDVTPSALEALIFRARRALAEELEAGLTCAEAERALSRRLDGRLPRRAARGLKAHMRECPRCTRFERVQKRQRSLLRGLSVMPVPASIFLFRGESAAAGGGALAAVGGAGGAAAGAGAAGVATGFLAKAAAVTAAAAVAGGVGYGVAAGPDPVTKAERKARHAAAVAETAAGARAESVRAARARGDRPGPAAPARRRAHPAKASAKAGSLPLRATTAIEIATQKAKKPKTHGSAAAVAEAQQQADKPAAKKERVVKPKATEHPAPNSRSRRPLDRQPPAKATRPEQAPLKPPRDAKEPPPAPTPPIPPALGQEAPVDKAKPKT